MTITAYINSSDDIVADKNISAIGSFNVDPYNAVDIERPVFILDYTSTLTGCNYIHVPDFGRFYYATCRVNNGGQIIIECISDPLKSFLTNLLNCDCAVTRSASVGHPTMYEDSKLPVYPNKNNVTSIEMLSDNIYLNSGTLPPPTDAYLLTVIGGTPSV